MRCGLDEVERGVYAPVVRIGVDTGTVHRPSSFMLEVASDVGVVVGRRTSQIVGVLHGCPWMVLPNACVAPAAVE